MLGMMDMVNTNFQLIMWKEQYPGLRKYWRAVRLLQRPFTFDLQEKAV